MENEKKPQTNPQNNQNKNQQSNNQKMIWFLLSNRYNFVFSSDSLPSLQEVGFLFFSVY